MGRHSYARRRSALRTKVGIVGVVAALLGTLLQPAPTAANHPEPTLPLTADIVQALSACTNASSALSTSAAKDRKVDGSDNRFTDGTIASIAVYANADQDPKELTLDISGSHNVVDGLVESRGHLKIGGSFNQLRHGTRYGDRSVSSKDGFHVTGSNNCFSPEPERVVNNAPVAPDGFPPSLQSLFDPDKDGLVLEHFHPSTASTVGSPVHSAMNDAAAGPQYFVCGVPDPDGAGTGAAVAAGCDQSAGKMDRNVQGANLEPGLYFITGEAILSASNLNARVTIVAGKQLRVNGSFQGQQNVFTPYHNQLLFATEWIPDPDTTTSPPNGSANTDQGEDALKVEGSRSRFEGVIVATNGRVELAGEQNDFRCPVMGDRVRLNGSKLYIKVAECAPAPALSIAKTPDGSVTVNAGENADFTITVSNSGGGPANNVDIDDTLPGTGWSFVGAAPGCTLTGAGVNVLHCDIASIAAGGSFTITVRRATTTADCSGSSTPVRLDNGSLTASTADDAKAVADNNPTPVFDPGHLFVRCPDASVSKTPDGGIVQAGNAAVFTINVTANGPGKSFNVSLNDPLPNGARVWSELSDPSNACSVSPVTNPPTTQQLTCSWAEIPFGETRTVQVSSPTGADDCGDEIRNTVTISASGDTNSSNNTDLGTINVRCGALLILKKSTKKDAQGNNVLVKNAGAVFSVGDVSGGLSVIDNNTPQAGSFTDASNTIGEICVEDVVPGNVTVSETKPPPGYGPATGSVIANVVAGTNCSSNKPTSGIATFLNPPLADIQLRFRDGGSGETALDQPLACNNVGGTSTIADTTGWDDTLTISGIPINPSPQTITCTFVIDP